jgi:nucleolar protein 15
MDREAWEKRVDREEQKRVEKAEKMKELGYEFDMPSVKAVESVPEQKTLKQADEEPKTIEAGAAAKPAEVEVKVVTEEPLSEPVKVTVAVEEKPKKRAASKDGKAKAKKAKKN